MKARIRNTNIEVDVQPLYDETGYFAGFKDGYEYYRAVDLVFPDTPDWDKTDWSSFRREAAKEMLPITSNWKLTKAGGTASIPISKEAACKLAIEYADELIKQLKGHESPTP